MNYETAFRLMTGERRTFSLSGVVICWEGKECILTIGNDITEMREYQNEMSRLSNLNHVGQMAASIAHEIRNPMTTIRGFLQLFQGNERYSEDRPGAQWNRGHVFFIALNPTRSLFLQTFQY